MLWCNAAGCDVSYKFPANSAGVQLTKMEVTLTWWTVTPSQKANVYLSTATGTGCNSGYFGAQFHSDGTQLVLFSMWDAPSYKNSTEWEAQGIPASPNCRRNPLDSTGKSTGVQCAIPAPPGTNGTGTNNVSFSFGVPYTFEFGIIDQNASGALWEVSVFDPSHKNSISVGKMFLVDAPMGLPADKCRGLGTAQAPPTLGPSAYTFMEYYESPTDFVSSATWANMKTTGPQGAVFHASDIVSECCYHDKSHNETSLKCVPPECDALELRLEAGPLMPVRKSAILANPTCFQPKPLGYRRPALQDCWRGGPPLSLDQCFGLPSSEAEAMTPALVV